jgi:plasmid stabilization system protein ParE
MITYQAFGLVQWLALLDQERRIFGTAPDTVMDDRDRQRIDGFLTFAGTLVDQLELTGTENRIVRFRQAIRGALVLRGAVALELRTLYEALQDDLNFKYFYFYPGAKASLLLRLEGDWAKTLAAFPAARADATSAVDCYAIGHNNAAVFSCMMVLERGLESLAADVGLTFDTQQWKTIIDEIEKKIESIRDHGLPGTGKKEKDGRLQFLSEAAKEFFYFKDAWRNYVSHGHAAYDEYQALGVVEHTRAFMNHLSDHLSEVS